MRTKLGNILLGSTLAVLLLILISELQHWTKLRFDSFGTDGISNYPEPAVALNFATTSVAVGLSVCAIIATVLASLLLLGRQRLLILTAVWATLGVAANGYFYAGLGGWHWMMMAGLPLLSAFALQLWQETKIVVFRREPVPDMLPSEQRVYDHEQHATVEASRRGERDPLE